eukprot:scaffold2373_cov239-Pinguiococcus_pyrenoidosus.AAC.4
MAHLCASRSWRRPSSPPMSGRAAAAGAFRRSSGAKHRACDTKATNKRTRNILGAKGGKLTDISREFRRAASPEFGVYRLGERNPLRCHATAFVNFYFFPGSCA